MADKKILDDIKKLREMTGVGFKDCKSALDETNGDIEKSIEFLRKKGIAKASKKMSRTASEGLVLAKEHKGEISILEINSETDFVAKNKDFVNFCKELSEINHLTKGNLTQLNDSKMKNGILVKDNLVRFFNVLSIPNLNEEFGEDVVLIIDSNDVDKSFLILNKSFLLLNSVKNDVPILSCFFVFLYNVV